MENWTGYSVNNPFKVNQDVYFIHKDILDGLG